MAEYDPAVAEKEIRAFWNQHQLYKVTEDPSRPPFYVLDMFPYPSGAGLHVGHPLGYIASDIYARYKRLKGYNVLHPMGYDAFGLPAEQYAIQTGQHPEVTTEQNIARYREQLENIGFSFDWSREIRTCDPEYYKWTQWVFIQLFHHYYNTDLQKARPIAELVEHLSTRGTDALPAACGTELSFTAAEWQAMSELEQSNVLMNYRLAYLGESVVNWCAELGTVLANDEVSEGLSIRGGYPVVQRKMTQWCLRISAYAPRLLADLEELEWTDSLKETQRNWIGRSQGAEVKFAVAHSNEVITVFTTRPDTLMGVSFMVLAPESDYVSALTTPTQKEEIENYIAQTKRRTERERMIDRKVTGAFTGSYAIHPITGEQVPIWISDYVLSGYGTGAVMAVPAHDSRDFAFARAFNLPIRQVVVPVGETESNPADWETSIDSKEGTLVNSRFLDGLSVHDAIQQMGAYLQEHRLGRPYVTFRLRDAIFSRQRYWGEPFPVYYQNGIPHTLDPDDLPLRLPEVDKYLPTESGEPPLGRALNWHNAQGDPFELSTMPGFAGSSAYYLRYMSPHNNTALVSKEANNYWRQVNLYIGGTEHATGHLIYSRFWNKFLYDLDLVCEKEPFKRLVNQGMIQGRSNFVYRVKGSNRFVTLSLKDNYDVAPMHVDISLVKNDVLDTEAFRRWRPDLQDAEFITEPDGRYICGWAVEKMSKSLYNVVNPDEIVAKYGADTLRLYEMFLGPLEQSKPWDTNGIDGVWRFLKKLRGLCLSSDGSDNQLLLTDDKPTPKQLKSLHKLIKKVGADIENFSFNTAIPAFMICLNELQEEKARSKEIFIPLLTVLSPFAPHLAEYIWQKMRAQDPTLAFSILDAPWPEYNEAYLVEQSVRYPVSFNGKVRFQTELPATATPAEVEAAVRAHQETERWLQGAQIKKIIVVPGRIVNVVTAAR